MSWEKCPSCLVVETEHIENLDSAWAAAGDCMLRMAPSKEPSIDHHPRRKTLDSPLPVDKFSSD